MRRQHFCEREYTVTCARARAGVGTQHVMLFADCFARTAGRHNIGWGSIRVCKSRRAPTNRMWHLDDSRSGIIKWDGYSAVSGEGLIEELHFTSWPPPDLGFRAQGI